MCAKEVRGGGASASGVHGGPSPSLAEALAAVYGLKKNSLNMSVPSGFMYSCAIFISPGKIPRHLHKAESTESNLNTEYSEPVKQGGLR